MNEQAIIHPAATGHLPAFITMPGETDILFNVMIIFLIVLIFAIGLLYLRLHALPEHMAHGGSKVQFQIVGVLALLALFTHNHLFWIGALLLALIEFPDFTTPLSSMARSLDRLAEREPLPVLDRSTERSTQVTAGSEPLVFPAFEREA